MPGQHLLKTIDENPNAIFTVKQGINEHKECQSTKPIRVLYERVTEGKKRNWKPVAIYCSRYRKIAWLDEAAIKN